MGRPSSVPLPNDGRRVFVRYANRRLYDTESHEYVPCWLLMEQPRGTFVVIDQRTGSDITKWQLAMVRADEERTRLAAWANRLGIRSDR